MSLDFQALQDRLVHLRENKIFETFVIVVILVSALVIGAKTYAISPAAFNVLKVLDIAVTGIFLFEIIIRMFAEKNLFRFFSKGWNIFDFIIVVASILPIEHGETAMLGRLLRIFRVLRLISIIPELRVLLAAFVTAIPRMGYVSLLMFIFFYIYAAMGSIFFANINPVLWDNISISMLTLFRIATFEDWTDVMYETMEVYPFSWIFYLSFIFIVAFVFLNMMIGIVLETLQAEHQKNDRENGEGEAGEVHIMEQRTRDMDQRLIKIEGMLEKLLKK
ncbi:MAG: ion transporter [Gammaproteobacteria bacterium]|nr:ion transporter [Gammaproteobacteria bacterium]